MRPIRFAAMTLRVIFQHAAACLLKRACVHFRACVIVGALTGACGEDLVKSFRVRQEARLDVLRDFLCVRARVNGDAGDTFVLIRTDILREVIASLVQKKVGGDASLFAIAAELKGEF